MRFRLLLVLAALSLAPMASAATYSLNDWCFYVNSLDINQSCNSGGDLANVPSADPGTTDLLHLQGDGLGTLTVTLAPGNYNVFAIFNYNIDGNGSGEYATALGNLAVGQVYSVNTEGSVTTTGPLDSTNHCASPGCADVAVGLGYTNVDVPIGSVGTVTFTASTTAPTDPNTFSVQQTNPNTTNSLNLTSALQISAVPEPGAMGLMGGGLGAMLLLLRRRKA